jgi:DNA polymerase I-like protein with 3'-5' exonuclease and polymerase domains
MKEIIIPEPGHTFMDADLSAAEARAMAYFMNSQIMKDVLNGPLKIHYKVGEWIYDKPWQELNADEYLIAKKTVHGSNYKMGVNLFSRIIGKPVHEARAIQEKYFTVVPELPKYHRDIQHEVESNRRLTNPFGRTRIFTGRIDQTAIGSGYAQKPQSTIVDMMNFGILSLYLLKPDNIHLITQTHDSVLVSLPPQLYTWWSTYMKSHLEVLRRIKINGDTLNIPIEIEPPKSNWLGK